MAEMLEIQLPGPVSEVALAEAKRPQDAPSQVDEEALRSRLRQEMHQAVEQDKAALAQARKVLEEATAQVRQLQQEIVKEAETQLLDLAVQIAGKVLAQEIQAGRYEIEPIVTEALSQVSLQEDVVVRMNPDDLERCHAAEEQADGEGQVTFTADPGVQPGECVVVTSEGVVDSSPDERLGEVADALKGSE